MEEDNLSLPGEDGNHDGEDENAELKKLSPQLYDMRISKGKVEGLPINLWDKVRDCRGEECDLFDTCPYFQNKVRRDWARTKVAEKKPIGLCRIEQKYLAHNLKPFLSLIQRVPDQFVVQTIGMHLIPLYHDLVQLKMEKASLKSISYKDSKGTKRIDPVFDQLLKTHKEIITIWRTSGLQDIAKKVGFMLPKEGLEPSGADLYLNGDGGSYDAMTNRGE